MIQMSKISLHKSALNLIWTHNQLKDSKTAKRISCIWFHTARAIGRHLDHRIADRPTATGTEEIT